MVDSQALEALGVVSGYGLNVAERAGLEVAMLQVKLAEKLLTLDFWGRIYGDTADYLVVVATLEESSKFPSKKFYYTTTLKVEKLSQMPELTESFRTRAQSLTQKPFTGEASMPYDDVAEEDQPEPQVDENGDPLQPELFREEHRLAFHVKQIDVDACVAPRGAYLVDSKGNVVKNKTYDGLTFEAAGFLSSYFHFRPPTSPHAQQALAKAGVVRPGDFLDPIKDDKPPGCWALQCDASKQIAFLRSLYYPGAFFFHKIATNSFGNVYVGDGLPNDDLQFML